MKIEETKKSILFFQGIYVFFASNKLSIDFSLFYGICNHYSRSLISRSPSMLKFEM